ncbi:hypothetical protein [Geobacillus sp. T6]|uniref:hypothetical protein n=1 Tax=Geobacillus sp. T6 TaxID=1659191 RepID=UPI0012FF0C47|nr:hypothetical protein [Geobacillus sp. T6]
MAQKRAVYFSDCRRQALTRRKPEQPTVSQIHASVWKQYGSVTRQSIQYRLAP